MNFDGQAVLGTHAVDQLVGLRRQASGVKRENRDRQGVLGDEVGQHHVLGAEAAGKPYRCMACGDPAKERGDLGDASVDAHACSGAAGGGGDAMRRRNSGRGVAAVA